MVAEAADGGVDFVEVGGYLCGGEDVVPVLSVGEVVVREVSSGHDQLVIYAIELHMLESPSFIDAARDHFLAQTGEIWGVEHAYFYSLWSEFCYQGSKERGT